MSATAVIGWPTKTIAKTIGILAPEKASSRQCLPYSHHSPVRRINQSGCHTLKPKVLSRWTAQGLKRAGRSSYRTQKWRRFSVYSFCSSLVNRCSRFRWTLFTIRRFRHFSIHSVQTRVTASFRWETTNPLPQFIFHPAFRFSTPATTKFSWVFITSLSIRIGPT